MGKVAKYRILEEQQEKYQKQIEKYHEDYSRHRKASKLSPFELLTALHEKKLNISDIPSSEQKYWQGIVIGDLSSYERLKKVFSKSDKFYLNKLGMAALYGIFYYSKEWIRNIDDWVPKRKNPDAQYRELISFLFKKYPVPAFLDYSFATGNGCNEATELFMLIAKGGSFKKFPFAPELVYTHKNKIYHHILTTPPEFSYFEAFRRAQILSMGGDEQLVQAFLKTRIGNPVGAAVNDNFWITVIQLFIGVGMFNYDKLGEIVDYIANQKFQRSPQLGNNIPQPNMTMHGRTVETLLRQSDNWHENQAHAIRLNRRNEDEERRRHGVYYRPSVYSSDTRWEKNKNIQPFHSTKIVKKELITYSINEITTYEGLLKEGKMMINCVATYVGSCLSGACSIFSFKINNENIATIEVRGSDIRQVKEKHNKKISDGNADIIMKWASTNYLRWKA